MCNSKLKKQRLSKNLTQLQLANKLKIHVSHYQRLEYGTRKPRLTLALNLAEILNTTVEELFGYMLDNYLLLGSSDTPNK